MKRLSLQWRITLMTALLVCVMCVLMNCLIGYSGMRYMDSIGSGISACGDIGDGAAASFDPDNRELDEELTIVVSNAQESFSTDQLAYHNCGDAARWCAGVLRQRPCAQAAAGFCVAG